MRPTRAELRHRGNDKKLWRKIVSAAQATYVPDPEYGLSDADMEKAIRAALSEWALQDEKLPEK